MHGRVDNVNPINAHSSRNQRIIIPVAVFALAFVVRIIFAFQWQDMPYGATPILDARSYDDWAQAIAQGHWLRVTAFYQSPLYPYLLAAIYKIFGHSYLAASILNDLLDAGTTTVLSLISFSLFGRTAAITTGLLAALYTPMIFYTAPLMKEPLMLFLLALFLMEALHAVSHGKKRHYALAGFLLGLTVLARGNALLLLPVLPVAAFVMRGRDSLKCAVIFVCALLLAVAPATLHNYLVSRDFVPVVYADGYNLYLGQASNGTIEEPKQISTGPSWEEKTITLAAEHNAGHKLKPSEVSAYWRHRAVDFVWENPGREVAVSGLKLYLFLNGMQRYDNYDPAFIRQNFPSVFNLPLIGFLLVITLATFALVGGWRFYPNRMWLLTTCAAVYMSSVVLFYVTERYRLPIVVFLLPLAGAAVPSAIRLWRENDREHLTKAVMAGLAVLAISVMPPGIAHDFSAIDWGMLADIHADNGNAPAARDAFEKGIAVSPTGVGVLTYEHMASMYRKLGDHAAATQIVERMAALFPEDGAAQYELGKLQTERGDVAAALSSLKKAQRLSPFSSAIYRALAEAYLRMNDKDAARAAVIDGLAIEPDSQALLTMKWELGSR